MSGRRPRAFALALLGCGAGFGWFYAHAMYTTVPAARLDGVTAAVSAVALDYPQRYENYDRLEVRLETEGLPRLNALLYDNSRSLGEAKPGDRVELEARLRPADRRYGEADAVYNVKDIYLILSAKGEVRLIPGAPTVGMLPRVLFHRLNALMQSIFPADTEAFFRALTLGDKTELYRDARLQLALSRAGLMHMTAVSGMHLVFLIGLIRSALGRGRRSALFCLAAVWLFVLLTGAGPSAVRAGVMQSLLLLAPLLRRENDSLTSLSAALALLLLLNPYAAASTGLQLSFAALAGLLCFSARLSQAIYRRWPRLRRWRLVRGAVGAFVSSLSVLPFTMPLMGLHFGFVSLLSPLSNLFAFAVVSICFGGAYLAGLLGLVYLPLGRWLGWVLAWLARYVFLVAKATASLPLAAVYLDRRETVAWLLLAYALFLGFGLMGLRRPLRIALPALLTAACLGLTLYAARMDYERGAGTFAALDVGEGQCLCALLGESTLMIDCGGLGTADNAGETAGAWLFSRGRAQVDALLLTHGDTDHCNGVARLMALCPVRKLFYPTGALDGNNETIRGLLDAAREQGTELIEVREDSELRLGELCAELFPPPADAQGNDACLSCVLSFGSYDVLVTGDMSLEAEARLLERLPGRAYELYVVGHHGSKYASSEALLRGLGADTAVVSCGYNTYGHPAPETLERLQRCGYTVWRTDEGGTIEVRIGRDYGEEERSA